jgi:hypothetical protein
MKLKHCKNRVNIPFELRFGHPTRDFTDSSYGYLKAWVCVRATTGRRRRTETGEL